MHVVHMGQKVLPNPHGPEGIGIRQICFVVNHDAQGEENQVPVPQHALCERDELIGASVIEI
jgi:hypothetical protein